MHSHRMENPNQIETFLKAGKAKFTLVSEKTGTRFTYRVDTIEDSWHPGKMVSFVKVLTGNDNENNFSYLGMLETTVNGLDVRLTDKSRITTNAPSFKAIQWFVRRLSANRVEGVEFWHEGQCGRCARPLTVPASIESGFGPECIKYV